ncbi:MAG TPA: Ig-like domain-containing protein [Longimicrobium sp.]|nr:Ig-like domain-containing protein [Longimicrobium sp.]
MQTTLFRRTSGALLACALAFTAACDGGTDGSNVDTVEIDPLLETLFPGDTMTFFATAFDDDGDEVDFDDDDAEWSASPSSVLSVNDNGRVTANSTGSGTVTVEIGGESDQASVDVIQDPFGECAPRLVPVGSTTNGTLDEDDCFFTADNSFVDFYELRVRETRQVTITMSSSAVDAYLLLADRVGESLVDEDDDGAGGTNARITATLSPGRYLVGANTAFGEEFGNYTLTIQ